MKLKTLIIPLILFYAGLAYGEQPLLEFPCQDGIALIQPKIKLLPEGYGIQFITTWGNTSPYVLVNDSTGEYEADIINNTITDKFMGYLIVKSPKISSIQLDGCQVQWSVSQ